MKKIIKKFNNPGKWEIIIPFEKIGEEKDWVGIVDARKPGDYELRVVADHRTSDTKGRITVRAVAGPDVNVTLRGVIKIRKGAQQTDNFLELRVLMLDSTSRAVAEPELEIEANNVKASHAASIGQMDKEQVVYLMSRGLDLYESQEQIVKGWLGV